MNSVDRKHIYFGYMLLVGMVAALFFSRLAGAQTKTQDLLIKLAPQKVAHFIGTLGMPAENLGGGWLRVQPTDTSGTLQMYSQHPDVLYIQPNYRLKLMHEIRFEKESQKQRLVQYLERNPQLRPQGLRPDNPPIPESAPSGSGPDPLVSKQWGMLDTGAAETWSRHQGSPEMVVAVLDTGVDYTHEDLLPNLWKNPREIPDNGIDDDNNGYVDDVIGWDFAANDNKPYDLAVDNQLDLLRGGNPGHGTHCAGNVAARGDNGIGISGVAPRVKIMSLRFISEKGYGTTADAVRAIRYAVDNGAKILSNSWGGEGQDDNSAENLALKEAVQYANDKGTLFVAAAGNGRNGKGFDNDRDNHPVFPASYTFENILTVAALDSSDRLGTFSNWGATKVHIGAPGVKVFSTVVGNEYSDVVIDKMGIKAYWDGTSMATPHVAGAAALYWSEKPHATAQDVKNAILRSARKIPSLSERVSSEGKLDVKELMK